MSSSDSLIKNICKLLGSNLLTPTGDALNTELRYLLTSFIEYKGKLILSYPYTLNIN